MRRRRVITWTSVALALAALGWAWHKPLADVSQWLDDDPAVHGWPPR